ncbi:Hypothetical predicted protein, partial [Pelobates cultripes]
MATVLEAQHRSPGTQWRALFEAQFDAICHKFWLRIAQRAALRPPMATKLHQAADPTASLSPELGAHP